MKWYQKSWRIILILIVFFPIGIYLMWRYAKWNKIIKSVITGIFALMVIGSVSTPVSVRKKPKELNAKTAFIPITYHRGSGFTDFSS